MPAQELAAKTSRPAVVCCESPPGVYGRSAPDQKSAVALLGAVALNWLFRVEKADEESHPHQLGERSGLHLLHDIRPAQLDRPQTDIEIGRNPFVGMPRQQP